MMKSAVIILALISAVYGAPPARTPQRIVGGSSTVIQEYPYIGALLRLDWIFWAHACGGSLITTRTVLTAAHCFFLDNNNALWRVRFGSSFKSSGGQIHQAAQLILHEDYDHSTLNYDIAILRMATPATLSDSVQLVSIPPPLYNIPDNQRITAIGWGSLDQAPVYPEQLQHVDVNIINQQLCYDRYIYLGTIRPWPYVINDGMFCIGIVDVGGKDACQGDSGGPVSLKTADGHVVIGVISWGFGCAHEFYPGVNTRTSYYSDWIIRHGSIQTS